MSTFRIVNLYLFLLLFSQDSLQAKEHLQPSIKFPQDSLQSPSVADSTKSRLFFNKNNFAVVTASALNLRSGPGMGNPVIKILPKGTHVLSLSSENDAWMKVFVPHKIEGWVAQKHVKTYQPNPFPLIHEKKDSKPFRSFLEAGILNYMEEIYAHNKLKVEDKLSIIVQDLDNENIVVSINPRKSVKSASTIKVPILHAYMIQRSSGNLLENTKYKMHVEKMIRFSSNESTNVLIKLLGGPEKIQHLLENTNVYKELKLIETIPENGRAYLNKISVADLNQIFKTIWYHRVIGSEYSKLQNKIVSNEMLYLLGLPGHSWLKDRIKEETCFSTNKTVKIWDKTGFVQGANGNAGIVEINTPHGRKAYSIVLFIEREDYNSITGDAINWFEQVSMHMRRISEMTYAYFLNRYHSYNQCGLSLLIRHAKRAFISHPAKVLM